MDMKYYRKHNLKILSKHYNLATDNLATVWFVTNWKPTIENGMEINHAGSFWKIRIVRIMIQGPKQKSFQSNPPQLALNFPIECFMEGIKPVA